jgi:methylenetetrahydrofolate reductase (NADPH)
MAMARDMRDSGVLPSGRTIEPAPRFFIGAADVPRVPDEKWEAAWLFRKIDGGAGFIQTQFCFDLDVAEKYIGRLREEGITERAGVIVGIGPIRSARSALWMNENLYGVHVPDVVTDRLAASVDAAAEGREICAEMISGLRAIPGVAGVHIMAPGGGARAIADVLERVESQR